MDTKLSNWTTNDLRRNNKPTLYSNCKTQVTWLLAQCSGGHSDGTVFIHTKEASFWGPHEGLAATLPQVKNHQKRVPQTALLSGHIFWVNQNFLKGGKDFFFFFLRFRTKSQKRPEKSYAQNWTAENRKKYLVLLAQHDLNLNPSSGLPLVAQVRNPLS